MSSLNTKIRTCPVCGDRAVLSRNDQLCCECIIDVSERSCRVMNSHIDLSRTHGFALVVADVNSHAMTCRTCTGLVTTTI